MCDVLLVLGKASFTRVLCVVFVVCCDGIMTLTMKNHHITNVKIPHTSKKSVQWGEGCCTDMITKRLSS